MTEKEVFKGVPGILRPFREFVEKQVSKRGAQIVYYGCPGTCSPFVELLGFAVRSLDLEQVFVPYVEESKAKKLALVPDVGMQASGAAMIRDPAAVVVMGGLSMPDVPVTLEQVASAIGKYPAAKKIGVCFMNMFEKTGWTKEIRFDLLIDATIDPVTVWK
jgi:hypothetical protein